jgi:hypothetical protein
MVQCKHHIIANSYFSWWGAWLSEHVYKIVIALQKWFAHMDADIDSRFPKDWIIL